jgi:opacity protein-like surface antigen
LSAKEKKEMEKVKAKAAIAIIAALIWLPTASEAAENSSGWYAGADVGQARLSVENPRIVGGQELSDTALSAHGGYRFSRYLALEGSFADLGDFHYTADTCVEVCIPEEAQTQFQHAVTRLSLSVVGAVPIGQRWQAYARAGLASTHVETLARNLVGAIESSDGSDVSPVYGVGLRASVGGQWSMRLQWDRSSHSKGNDLDVSTLWLGAQYQFGT